MTYLLDTNACINYLNGRSEKIRQKLELLDPQEIVLCSVVKAELFYGAARSSNPEKNRDKINHFLARFVSLPFDDQAAEAYGSIRARLERMGALIGPNDLLIAAISVSNAITIVTHNTREFSRVDGLRLEDWEA
ncbi:MAG: type II toxin-antitoxin system VapC family toxin [candidate division KSB1 bacterium]